MNSFLTFLSDSGLTFDKIYVDKFYHSICDKKWILVDLEVLKWIGYESLNKEYKNKQKYLDMVSSHFDKEKDFKLLSSAEFNNLDIETINIIFKTDISTNGNKTQYLIISPRCFKESLLMLKTDKASDIRKYYLDLEEYFNKYVEYTTNVTIAKLKEENEKLKNQSILTVNYLESYKPVQQNSYVYVISSKHYIANNVFKIGHTKYLNDRVKSYKTGRHSDDNLELIFSMKVVDGKSAEQYIFSKIDQFRETNEMYCINYYMLIEIMNEFKRMEDENTNKINSIISKYEPKEIKEINMTSCFEEIVQKANEDAGLKTVKSYIPPVSTQFKKINSAKHLNTESINNLFKSVKLCLEKEYTGSVDESQNWRCLNVLEHTFTCKYENARREYLLEGKGCPFCRKQQVIDKIKWFAYKDKSYEYICSYDSFKDLKEKNYHLSESNIKIIKNIVREERWLTPVEGVVYSILSPENNTLDMNKQLTDKEQFIIQKLGINYKLMKQRIFKTKYNYVLAVDEKNKKVYFGESMTKLSTELTYVGGSQRLNRKTISKYVDSNSEYAGYIFMSGDDNVIATYGEKKYTVNRI